MKHRYGFGRNEPPTEPVGGASLSITALLFQCDLSVCKSHHGWFHNDLHVSSSLGSSCTSLSDHKGGHSSQSGPHFVPCTAPNPGEWASVPGTCPDVEKGKDWNTSSPYRLMTRLVSPCVPVACHRVKSLCVTHPSLSVTVESLHVFTQFNKAGFTLSVSSCAVNICVFECVTLSWFLLLIAADQRRTQQQEQLSFRYKEMIKCQTLPHRGEQVSCFCLVVVSLSHRFRSTFTP